MNLKEDLKKEFNLEDSDFDSHESDLYVRLNVCGLIQFLQDRKIAFMVFKSNIKPFDTWLDIPFMNEGLKK